jgi:transcriptional regulator with XRE-family HTH domain
VPLGKRWLVAKPIGADIKRRFGTYREIFGLAITQLRIDRKLNQGDVAAAVKCKEGFLRRIERGTTNFSFDLGLKILRFYDMLPYTKFWAYAEDLAEKKRLAEKSSSTSKS